MILIIEMFAFNARKLVANTFKQMKPPHPEIIKKDGRPFPELFHGQWKQNTEGIWYADTNIYFASGISLSIENQDFDFYVTKTRFNKYIDSNCGLYTFEGQLFNMVRDWKTN